MLSLSPEPRFVTIVQCRLWVLESSSGRPPGAPDWLSPGGGNSLSFPKPSSSCWEPGNHPWVSSSSSPRTLEASLWPLPALGLAVSPLGLSPRLPQPWPPHPRAASLHPGSWKSPHGASLTCSAWGMSDRNLSSPTVVPGAWNRASCPGLPEVVLLSCWWVFRILVSCPSPSPTCQPWDWPPRHLHGNQVSASLRCSGKKQAREGQPGSMGVIPSRVGESSAGG